MSSERPRYQKPSEEFFSSIEDILTSTGRGIAEAQKELDLASLEIQREIDANPDMQDAGVEAKWYTMPETDLTIKMALTVEENRTNSGKANPKLLISPVNASFQNQFNFSKEVSSEIHVKIVPIPTPKGATKIIPDVVGLPIKEGLEVLKSEGFGYRSLRITGTVEKDQDSEIKSLSPSVGTVVAYDYSKQILVQYTKR